jgi:glycine/D-amino acid oxidase-like deaminating enzyme
LPEPRLWRCWYCWLLYQLSNQNRRLLERVTLIESSTAGAAGADRRRVGLHEGMAAPPFELPALGGSRLGLADLLAPRQPLALVFVEPECFACQPVMTDLADLAAERAGLVGVAVLSVMVCPATHSPRSTLASNQCSFNPTGKLPWPTG